MNLSLDTEQQKVLDSVLDWYKMESRKPFITIGGYAGTGKTTLTGFIRERFFLENEKLKFAFVSYTGKAARVLRSKLIEKSAIKKGDNVSTIHSLIYSPIVDDNGEIKGWERRTDLGFQIIVLDEASMVDRNIWNDLLSFGIPIIAIGDHGQLPPIEGRFSLMEKPEFVLQKIYRQAAENPIIELSIMARNEGKIPFGSYSNYVKKYDKREGENYEKLESLISDFDNETLILTGFNASRIRINKLARNVLGFESPQPSNNDRVICLKNNHEKGIYNGSLGKIINIKDENETLYNIEIKFDDDDYPYAGKTRKDTFNNPDNSMFSRSKMKDVDLFDFGYALTVHKAQGSQASKVILFEERSSHMDDETWRRWLYTAVTRAADELYIFA